MSKRQNPGLQNPGLPGRTIMRHFSKLWHRHFLTQFFWKKNFTTWLIHPRTNSERVPVWELLVIVSSVNTALKYISPLVHVI